MSLGEEFAQIMIDSADEKSPWAAFTEQSSLWNPENLKKWQKVLEACYFDGVGFYWCVCDNDCFRGSVHRV